VEYHVKILRLLLKLFYIPAKTYVMLINLKIERSLCGIIIQIEIRHTSGNY